MATSTANCFARLSRKFVVALFSSTDQLSLAENLRIHLSSIPKHQDSRKNEWEARVVPAAGFSARMAAKESDYARSPFRGLNGSGRQQGKQADRTELRQDRIAKQVCFALYGWAKERMTGMKRK